MNFIVQINNVYNPNYRADEYSHYMVIESIQFVNRERGEYYQTQGSICIGYPKFFFKVKYSIKNMEKNPFAEIIDSKEINYRSGYSDESYHKEKIYDFPIKDLKIFNKENFNFSLEDKRDQKIEELLDV